MDEYNSQPHRNSEAETQVELGPMEKVAGGQSLIAKVFREQDHTFCHF
jgi:hypothetical protein